MELSGQFHAPATLPQIFSVFYCVGISKYPRARLEALENSLKKITSVPGIEQQFLGCPSGNLATVPFPLNKPVIFSELLTQF